MFSFRSQRNRKPPANDHDRDQELWACALAIERQHGGVFSHAAIEINRLDAEGEREAAGVWREVLKRLNALTERSAAAT